MTKEKNSEYYDDIFSTSPHYSLYREADNTIYKQLYNFLLSILNKEEDIIEYGCGTGQFAEKLINDGYKYILGIDFSEEGIRICRERCPSGNFKCENLNNTIISTPYTTILSIETMEHIENDLQILQRIEKGKRVVLSLPSFDDISHVRYFKTSQDIANYYSSTLNIMSIHKIDRHFVVDSFR